MNTKLDEYLEALWHLNEEDKESIEDLKIVLDTTMPESPFDISVIESLASEGMVIFDGHDKVSLSSDGSKCAGDLVRKHRLAERLMHDVLGFGTDRFEAEACTFEHLVAPHVVDGICTLLGHPRKCPHGLPIPEGECCKQSAKSVASSVIHLTDLAVGQSARIAYVNSQSDAQIHRLNGLQIKPGVEIKMHQKYPSCVVECEGAMIALDELIADNICVWKKQAENQEALSTGEVQTKKNIWRWIHK